MVRQQISAEAQGPTALLPAGASFEPARYCDAARLLPPVISTAQRSPQLTPALVHGHALISQIATKTNDNGLALVHLTASRALR